MFYRKAFIPLLCLSGSLVFFGVTPRSQAAPPQTSASQASLDAQDKHVLERLTWLINKRMKGANGAPIGLKVVPTGRASDGYFAEIAISGAPAKLKKLYVTKIALDAKNVKLDVPTLLNEHKIKTTKATTQLNAIVSDADITRMLAEGKGTQAMGLKVKFLPTGNRVHVTGNLSYALINGPVEGIGVLRPAGGSKVFLDITSLKLRGVETPGFVKNWLAGHVNPLIDYTDLPFSPPFKSFKIVGNKAYISTNPKI